MMKEKEKELTFEENLEKLESIVKDLESGNTPLDEAIDKFNEAIKIAKLCDDKLKKAEKAVSQILKEDGTLEDFKPEVE